MSKSPADQKPTPVNPASTSARIAADRAGDISGDKARFRAGDDIGDGEGFKACGGAPSFGGLRTPFAAALSALQLAALTFRRRLGGSGIAA
jgi:hypothetical protein